MRVARDAHRERTLNRQEVGFAVDQDGWLVTGITVMQFTGCQVEDADEESDEHTGLVVLTQIMVHPRDNAVGGAIIGGIGAEQAHGLRHGEGGRYTLATHITDTEIELVVAYEEIVEVAADSLGGGHRGVDLEIVAFREYGGHHRQLDVSGDIQLTLDGSLLCRGSFELVDILRERLLHVAEGIVQLTDLVVMLQFWQRVLEVPLRWSDGW